MSDQSNSSIDQIRSILRLYLAWPENVMSGVDEEANEFYLWLTGELGEAEVRNLVPSLDDIKHFISTNNHVLNRARYLKGRTPASANVREGTRIDINTQVFFLVYDCMKNPALEGRILRGILLDIARSGMRLETSLPVPEGSILSITVAQAGHDVTLYNLTGEVRWLSDHEDSRQIGISIFNIEDYSAWQDFYALNAIR